MITGINESKILPKHLSYEYKCKFDGSCENGKYLANIIDDSVIPYDEIMEETVPTNFNEKK